MTTITTDPLSAGPGIPARRGRLAALVRGRPADPRWARPALLAVLALTAALYTIGLSRNGWANDFYAAAVQAGTESWRRSSSGRSTPPASSQWTRRPRRCG